MRYTFFFLCIIFFALVLTSCASPSPAPIPTDAALPNIPTATIISTETPTAMPIPAPTRPQYSIDLQLDYASRTALVNETITYVNQSVDALTSLVLAVEPTCTQSFRLNALLVDGQPVNYIFDSQNVQPAIRHKLEIPLAQSLAPNGRITIQIAYGLILPPVANYGNENDVCSQIFGYTAQQINLVDWYPFIVPYRDGRWILNDPWYYGDHLTYETADFDVMVTFSDGSSPMIASSGEEIVSTNATSRMLRLEGGRSFAISFSIDYQVATVVIDDVTIYSYYFPFYPRQGNAALQATAQSLQLYNQRFGSYPHKTLSIVQGDFNDGMEYSSLYFHSTGIYNNYDGTLVNHLTAVAVHETAHQWWFEQVANDQGMEPWLDESLATYSEILFYETAQPDALDTWWWTYRFTPFEQAKPVDATIYDWYGGFLPYQKLTYLNGAHFLQALRARMGDDAFFAFLQDYLAQMRGKISSSVDFFRILRAHTNADISDLVTQYFQNPH